MIHGTGRLVWFDRLGLALSNPCLFVCLVGVRTILRYIFSLTFLFL